MAKNKRGLSISEDNAVKRREVDHAPELTL
jgi:hypothetical protein